MVDLSKLDPATMARHLGKPEGEIGRVLADSMAERNWPVYEAGFQRLAVQPGDRLFEVGFGNGKLVPRLLALAPGLTYAGIDFSETMVSEAEAFNQELIKAGRATFRLASVEAIPFAADAFDRALAVNTIYFLARPGPCACRDPPGAAPRRRPLCPGGASGRNGQGAIYALWLSRLRRGAATQVARGSRISARRCRAVSRHGADVGPNRHNRARKLLRCQRCLMRRFALVD